MRPRSQAGGRAPRPAPPGRRWPRPPLVAVNGSLEWHQQRSQVRRVGAFWKISRTVNGLPPTSARLTAWPRRLHTQRSNRAQPVTTGREPVGFGKVVRGARGPVGLRRDKAFGKPAASRSKNDDGNRNENTRAKHIEDPGRSRRSGARSKQKTQQLVDPVTHPLHEAVTKEAGGERVVARHGEHRVQPLLRPLWVGCVGRMARRARRQAGAPLLDKVSGWR